MNVAKFRDLQSIPTCYEELFAEQGLTSLFLTKSWFENLVSNGMEEGAVPYVFALEAHTTSLPQIALVMRTPAGQNGSKFATWKLGEQTLAGLTNFQTSYYSPLLRTKECHRADLYQTLARELSRQSRKWHLIDFNLLDPTSPSFFELASGFEKAGYRVGRYFYKGNWYEDITVRFFSDYLKSRSKSSRRAIQNYQRKFRKLQAVRKVHIDIFAGSQDLDRAMAMYGQVHASSWKELEHFPQFAMGLIRTCAAEGSLRMVFVMLDDAPAAVEFAIVTGQKAVMMKTAYDPRFSKESVGAIAVMKAIEYLIDVDNVTNIDFGTDDDQYKSVWVQKRRERWGLVLFNRHTVLGNLYWLRFLMGKVDQVLRHKLKAAYKTLSRVLPA